MRPHSQAASDAAQSVLREREIAISWKLRRSVSDHRRATTGECESRRAARAAPRLYTRQERPDASRLPTYCAHPRLVPSCRNPQSRPRKPSPRFPTPAAPPDCKGVMLSHHNLSPMFIKFSAKRRSVPDHRCSALLLPLYHIYGLTVGSHSHSRSAHARSHAALRRAKLCALLIEEGVTMMRWSLRH